MQPLIDFAAYLIVRLFIAVVQVMPEDRADALCHRLASLLAGPLPIRSKTIEQNLSRVFPSASVAQRAALRRAMWHHLMLMVCEIAWAPRRLHRCNWKQHVDFPNARVFLSRLLSRRPTVLVTGHFGNFEVGGYVTGLMGLSTTTIARRLDNAFLHDFVADFRGIKGQKMVDKEGCAAEVDRHLAAGGTLSLLADQRAGAKGCWVDFLGHPASCHKALALFTLSGDAPMAVAYTIRGERPMQFTMGCTGVADPRQASEECAGVRQLTRWYNDRLAEAIRLAPEQYWWMHNRWRTPPAKKAKRLAA